MIHETPELAGDEDAALASIFALRDQLRHYVAEPRRWLRSVRRVLAARAIQGSNSIEGFDVTVEDALAAIEGDEAVDAELSDWQAVDGYRRAMTYVLQLASDPHFEYSEGLLRSLHFMMTEYSLEAGPGLWRPGAIWVRNDDTGEIVYEGPSSDSVPGLVAELVSYLRTHDDVTATVRAAMAHLNLVMIHPFRDGNGRMARCLQTLVLAREGVVAQEFCSIEEYLGRNTGRYYDVLATVGEGRWNPGNDARPWIRFCLEAHYVQAASVLRRIREAEQMWGELEEVVEAHALPGRAIAALFEATIGLRVRNASYRSALRQWDEQISHQVATSDLRAMVDAGMLVRHGVKRGTYYVASERLAAVRGRIVAQRTPIDPSALSVVAHM